MHHSEIIAVRKTKGKGRGVFARQDIAQGELLEEVPVIVIPIAAFEGEWENITLKSYFFMWTEKTVAISLGYGSIYNHSYDPNALFDFNYRGRTMVYRARRPIAKGEEITINYNYVVEDRTPMWFEMAQEKPGTNGKAKHASNGRAISPSSQIAKSAGTVANSRRRSK